MIYTDAAGRPRRWNGESFDFGDAARETTIGETVKGAGVDLLQGLTRVPEGLADTLGWLFGGGESLLTPTAKADIQGSRDYLETLKPQAYRSEQAVPIVRRDAEGGIEGVGLPSAESVLGSLTQSAPQIPLLLAGGGSLRKLADSVLTKSPRLAAAVGYGGANAAMVAPTGAEDVRMQALAEGASEAEADLASKKAFTMLAPLTALTGGAGGAASAGQGQQASNLLRAMFGGFVADAPFEGIEEAGQSVAGDVALGRQIDLANAAEAGLQGVAAGGLPGATIAALESRGAPRPLGDSYADLVPEVTPEQIAQTLDLRGERGPEATRPAPVPAVAPVQAALVEPMPIDIPREDTADLDAALAAVALLRPETGPAIEAAPAIEMEAPTRRADEIEAARMGELRTLRREGSITPEQSAELLDLAERDRLTARVAGRRILGVQNMEARTEAEASGQLKPVQAFADADNFKAVNDRLGHEVGDDVIRQMGSLFAEQLGDGNVFHRGGDEYVMQADTPEQLDAAMQAVRQRLADSVLRVTLEDGTVVEQNGVGFSYGAGPTIQEAESAQYRDKEARRAAGLRTDRTAQPVASDRAAGEGRQEAGEGAVDTTQEVEQQQARIEPASVQPPKSTGTKNAVMDAERAEAGRDPIIRDARKSNQSTVDEAIQSLADSPTRGAEVVERLRSDGVSAISLEDEAVLMVHKRKLMNERNKAADTLSDPEATEPAKAVAQREWERTESEISAIDEASYASGREWGRLGQFRQRMLREDFSLEAMERKLRAVTGEPLTQEQTAEIKALHEKLAKAQEKLEAANAQLAEAQSATTYDDLVRAMQQAAKGARKRPTLSRLREAANESRAALAAVESVPRRKGQSGAAINPAAFYHLARIGAYEFANGAVTLVDWTARMKTALSERFDEFREMLPEVFRASKVLTAESLGQGQSVDSIVSELGDAPTTQDVRKLAEAHIRAGLRGEGPVMAAVTASLQKNFPDLTEREVRVLFSEYGKATFPSKDEVKVELRRLRSLVQLQESITRLESGQPALKSGPQRDKDIQEIREKRTRLNELLKTLVKSAKTPEQLASYNDARIRNLNNQIEDLQKQIDTGERPSPRAKPIPSAEVQALIAKRDALRDEIRAIDKKPVDPEARYQEQRGRGIQRRIEELEKRIASGDFEKVKRVPRELDDANKRAAYELEKVKEEFERLRFEAEMERRTPLQKVLGGTRDAVNLARAYMTSVDLSGLLRQGGFISFGHPVRAAKSVPASLKAFVSEKAEFEANEEIKNRPNAPLYKKFGLELTGIGSGPLSKVEEAYATRWLNKLPALVGGGIVRGSGRSYTVMLNRLRADSFDAMVAALAKDGSNPTKEEGAAIANYINVATGRGKVGSSNNAGEVLNTVFFAPRLVASRFQLLAGQPLYGGTNRTRSMIVKEYARFLTGVGIAITLAAMMRDDDDETPTITWDPRSADFGKVRFGNTFLDPLAGLAQVTTFLGRMVTGETVTTKGVKPLRANYTLTDLRGAMGQDVTPHKLSKDGRLPFGSGDGASVLFRFLRSKLAPVPGAIVNTLAGQNMIGEPATPGNTALSLVTPMSMGNIADVMEEQGVSRGAAITLLGLLGMGVQYRKPKEAPRPEEAEEGKNNAEQ
jgi:diguanylate cyclase (GGDEF)-like protein